MSCILQATPNASRLQIIDARPKGEDCLSIFLSYQICVLNEFFSYGCAANAMANTAKGAGYEHLTHYPNCCLSFFGIGNIHVMRDSLKVPHTSVTHLYSRRHLETYLLLFLAQEGT